MTLCNVKLSFAGMLSYLGLCVDEKSQTQALERTQPGGAHLTGRIAGFWSIIGSGCSRGDRGHQEPEGA